MSKPIGLTFMETLARIQADQKRYARFDEFRKLSTEELKKLWDEFDGDAGPDEPGFFWPPNAPHIGDVHKLLNERGEGGYCAI